MKKVMLSILLLSLLAACASERPKEESRIDLKQQAPAIQMVQPAVETTTTKNADTVSVDALTDPNSVLAKRSIYYPLDVSEVNKADLALVAAHAKYLNEHPNQKVRLEGNCDERGSAEYNLALGQRRVSELEKLLLDGGVNANQMTTMSYGLEQPRLLCHEEKCWKENRRTDLVYLK